MDKLKNKMCIILLVLIIILQVIISVYATNKREDYHIDEYYSHGLMQYNKAFILYNDDFYNNWHNSEYFEDYLKINEQNKLDFMPIYTNQAQDVHPPIYYVLLRVMCSFNLGNFSKWPGIILNIIIASICTVILYLVGKRLFNSTYIALLLCFVNTMCIATIETITFIRMYELLTLNSLLLIYWHIINKDNKLEIKNLSVFGILIVTGFLTHYYYAIIVAGLYFMCIVKFIKEKKKKEVFRYTGTIMIAVLLVVIIFPYCIKHIFFGYRGKEVINNIGSTNKYIYEIRSFVEIVNEHILNGAGKVILAIIVFLGIIAVIEKLVNKDKQKEISSLLERSNINILYIIIPTTVYFTVISIGCRYKDFRYIMPIIPLVITIVFYIIHRLISIWASKSITIVMMTILCIVFSCSNIRKYGNNLYTFKEANKQVDNAIEIIKDKPFMVASMKVDVSNNKFMETYKIVTKIEQTYVLDLLSINRESLEYALKNKDVSNGIIVMVRWQEANMLIKDILKTGLFKDYNKRAEGVLTYYDIIEFM